MQLTKIVNKLIDKHIFHMWRYDSPSLRTCIECGVHEYAGCYSASWYRDISCKEYANRVEDYNRHQDNLKGKEGCKYATHKR